MLARNNNTTAAPKRRALGDITNAYTDDESKTGDNAVKKANNAFVPTTARVTEQSENVFDSDDISSAHEVPDYMKRPVDDIDSRDSDNPLLATEYVNEMYDHFNRLEKDFAVNPVYMAKQDFINEKMRTILVDWLVEVHMKFKMVPESLYICTQIIDRYLELKQVRRSKLQLVGVAALLLAAKYEEIYPPELKELVYITDKAYNRSEIVEMETDIANTLNYYFTVPTIHSFLCRYLKAAHADRTMVQLSCYLAERTLQEYSLIRFRPSTLAAASVYIARKSLKRHPWSPTLAKYTKYQEADLYECVDEMRACINNAACQQTGVYRKYSNSRFGLVAKMGLSF